MNANKKKGGIDLCDLVFSWSIQDVLNRHLFKSQVKLIPDEFSSITDYLNIFKLPLIEETREDFCRGLESVGQSPSCEISSVCFAKGYKPPKNLYYKITVKPIADSDSSSLSYEPESGDLLILSNKRPRKTDDVITPGEALWLARVIYSKENDPQIVILSSKLFSREQLSRKYERLFATYLMNLTSYMRIWTSLNPDPKTPNLGLIQNVLQYDASVDDDCSLCPSEGVDVNVRSWNVLDFVNSRGLDDSQKNAVLDTIRMRKCPHQMHKVKLIWGPPGTGKTNTVSCLLFALLKLNCTTLTCAPTNVAVLQVAKKLVGLFSPNQPDELDTYGLGDIVLFGNKKRMKIDDHDELVDVFLEYRCKILEECFSPFRGWTYNLKLMISLLDDPQAQYNKYLGNPNQAHEDKDDSEKYNNKDEVGQYERGSRNGNRKKSLKEVVNRSLKENKKNSKERNKIDGASSSEQHANGLQKEKNLPESGAETDKEREDLMTYEEFVTKTFVKLAGRLTSQAQDLYTHLPTSLLPLHVAKDMMKLVDMLTKALENPTKRFGEFELLMIKSEKILGTLNSIQEKLPDLGTGIVPDFWNLCLLNARLLFCTVSSSIKLRSKVELVVIDEAAQLKECESTIPFQIIGVKNAILVGDDRQLPAMVQSQALEDVNFGRSLFQRLATLGKKKHLLNIQYRMHPSISLFPNKVFYENKIVDAPNVKEKIYTKSFIKGDMYGPYCFMNVAKAKERFDRGHSPRNLEEVAAVDHIIAKLVKGNCITKEEISVGVISPYKGQIAQIQESLGKKYDRYKQKGLSVSIRSVDGFQGGEEDIIIISTVRCNGRGSVGFLSNHQRTNVALTRARYCLWIVGSGTTLVNSGTVWKDLVIDAKTRGCFYSFDENMNLHQDSMIQSSGSFYFDFLKVRKPRWKVVYSDDFNASMASITNKKVHRQVTEVLKKLAHGWRQLNYKIFMDAFELLEQYKVNKLLYLVWSVDILKEESQSIQVIKVWDILPPSKIHILVQELNIMFKSYTLDLVNRCKDKSYEGHLVVPKSWPLDSEESNLLIANGVECLSGQLAGISLKDNQGESSSGISAKYVYKKVTRGRK